MDRRGNANWKGCAQKSRRIYRSADPFVVSVPHSRQKKRRFIIPLWSLCCRRHDGWRFYARSDKKGEEEGKKRKLFNRIQTMTIICGQFSFLWTRSPLIAFTDSGMKYGECFKSTTPKLICMLMNIFFLRESWNVPASRAFFLGWGTFAMRYLERKSLWKGGELQPKPLSGNLSHWFWTRGV